MSTFILAKEKEFIPVWEGNDKADQPITFTCRYLTIPERDEVIAPYFDAEGKPHVKIDNVKAFRIGVTNIKNHTVNGNDITKSVDFLRLNAFYELMLEVASFILSMNAVTDSKNLP